MDVHRTGMPRFQAGGQKIALLLVAALMVLIPGTPGATLVPLYELPSELQLCGEPVPLNRQDVWEMLDQSFVLSVYNTDQVILWLKRAHRYFPHLEKRLQERKMPDDIKYVAVVESSFRTYAVSSAKAVGPWQFMERTAKRYGLKVNKQIDERLNFEKSTEAALDYLTDLYRMFGNWTLAAASYNCGEERVSSSISVQGTQSFYDLDLPLETERYIFRILAAKLILAQPEKYGYHIPRERRYPPLDVDRVAFSLKKEVHVTLIARAAGTTYKTIRELNPEIRDEILPKGDYALIVPKGRAAQFTRTLPDLLSVEPDGGKRSNSKKSKTR
ncbi:MAG TPA: lytic transglycosylase domain-containing protein [Syntrophales bacterium]|nr:lytic transglycosylase domain-containing protein [Syntrophales bacterium]HOX95225.1 lytic transglycosylase domain-containing protein [Syntrophales bacterium]HPI56458.1 lytic transglycosylase domain-containing protein [Syntrophales bacterium]HPN25121.1 lytic transglycosylase domain-containing protein [Syntrophales bacterium]HQM29136.1 lytic transglycosylase domain-containing protein [Syntrophales bacterium]